MIVYTVGTFDLLTCWPPCFARTLQVTRGYTLPSALLLMSVVNLYKPNVPVVPLEQRVEMLEALSCVDIVRPYHSLEYVSGCEAVKADIFVIGEDWGDTTRITYRCGGLPKKNGKKIVQVGYNSRTSSTRIKQDVKDQPHKSTLLKQLIVH